MRRIRFRTLGCYPLTGAIESDAGSITDILRETLLTTSSERQGRTIDKEQGASMEIKKQQGYFWPLWLKEAIILPGQPAMT